MRNALAIVTMMGFAVLGCSRAEPVPLEPSAPPPADGAGGERPAGDAALSGLWVEYWALEGHADTQRYALFADGRFGWRAAGASQDEVVRRWGEWRTEGATLVLRVSGHERRHDCQGDACQVQHDPPHEERLPIGECPPNDEAKALDASYRCISIGGQAFWRRAEADDPTAYLPPSG